MNALDTTVFQKTRHIPFNAIRHVLSMHAKTAGNMPYLVTIDAAGQRMEISYSEFNARAHQTANLLYDDAGVGRGDMVAVIIRGDAYSAMLAYACWIIGAVVVPLDPDADLSTHMQVISKSGATVIVGTADDLNVITPKIADLDALIALVQVGGSDNPPILHFDTLVKNLPTTFLGDGAPVKSNDDALPEGTSPQFVDIDDPALLLVNGDETVRFTQYHLMVGAMGMVQAQGITGGQKIASYLPLHTTNGVITALLVPLLAGAATLISETFDAATFWQHLTQQKASITVLNALQIAGMTAQGHEDMAAGRGLLGENISRRDLTRFRHVVCGDNGLTISVAEAFEDTFGFAVFNSLSHPQVAGFITLDALALSWNRRRALRQSVDGAICAGIATPFLDIKREEGVLMIHGHHVLMKGADDWLNTGYNVQATPHESGRRYWFVVG